MKILLTGRNGQVGYELERSLGGLGELVALGHAEMDLSDPEAIRAAIRAVKPGLIVNAAAYTDVEKAEIEPDQAWSINCEAPAVMAAEAKRLGAILVHYSTDYVFDGTKAGPYTEDDAPNPLNEYGRSKLGGEQAIIVEGAAHLILRTNWVYGLRGRNFLLTVRRLAAEKSELRIVADQVGTPTWCRTIAEATSNILAQRLRGRGDVSKWKSGVYHLSAQGQTSWHGFAEAIVAHPSIPHKPVVTAIASADYPLRATRPANSVLSCKRLIEEFGDLPHWMHALQCCLNESQHANSDGADV